MYTQENKLFLFIKKISTLLKEVFEVLLRLTIPLLAVFLLLKIYEFFTSGIKLQSSSPRLVLEIIASYYTCFTWLLYCLCISLPFILIYLLNKKAGRIFLLSLNTVTIISYFSLIEVFSERLIPFDHELFIRPLSESLHTAVSHFFAHADRVISLVAYIGVYFVFYHFIFKKIHFPKFVLRVVILFILLASIFINYSLPEHKKFSKAQDYAIVINKFHYFYSDCITYFIEENFSKTESASQAEIDRQIDLYHHLHNFKFVSKEYPLLHVDESNDVLGKFFNVDSTTLPNIVIIIYEGLSSSFSGPQAESISFTPFLDSLANHSLTWYNTLSQASATFASLPSITGSLPFGRKGFTFESNPADHLSLISILKKNNYQTNYFIGGESNFDNFAGYFRREGGEFVSTDFPRKYKKMGIGYEGWSAGYPDDALYNYSFEVLNKSKNKANPYLDIYLTLSTHDPYVFDELALYKKKFDRTLQMHKLSNKQTNNLRPFRTIYASYLFADDCMRNFFAKYSKRKEFKNTIFVIVGDHHNGSIPTENAIKCYNVPLIIYSPLLKKAEHFESVNAHINITPTLIALLRDSYHLQYSPHYVSWIGDVMDTCKSFRNIHDVPLIGVNRTIREYVYKENYLYLNSLYRFNTKMTQVEIVNDELVEQLNVVLDNFKFINSYVCNSNKLYPKDENMFESHETLLTSKIDTAEHVLSTTNTCEYIDKGSFIAKNNKQIKIKISLSGNIDPKDFFKLPSIAFYIYSSDGKRQLLYSPKEMQELYKMPSNNTVWGSYADEDIFDLSKYNDTKGYCIKIQLCNEKNIKMKIKDLKIEFLQIK